MFYYRFCAQVFRTLNKSKPNIQFFFSYTSSKINCCGLSFSKSTEEEENAKDKVHHFMFIVLFIVLQPISWTWKLNTKNKDVM